MKNAFLHHFENASKYYVFGTKRFPKKKDDRREEVKSM